MRARTVRVDRWEKTPTRTAQDKIKIKNPGRQPCWGSLFCTNLTQPTGALDHKATEQLIFLLKKLNKEGKTIVVVTHDMEMARSGTKQFYMEDGKIFPL